MSDPPESKTSASSLLEVLTTKEKKKADGTVLIIMDRLECTISTLLATIEVHEWADTQASEAEAWADLSLNW